MENLLQVGVVSSTHGVRGEVKVFPTTDDAKRFDKLKSVILMDNNEEKVLHVKSVKYFKKMVIVGFKEYETLNEVEALKGKPLFVTRKEAVALQNDEYFIADLIDMQVMEEETGLKGIITDVIQTGANDVYTITLEDKREFLLPAIKECILHVDMKKRVMNIHIMEGLLE